MYALCFVDGDNWSKPAKIPLVEKKYGGLFASAEKFEAKALSNVTLVIVEAVDWALSELLASSVPYGSCLHDPGPIFAMRVFKPKQPPG